MASGKSVQHKQAAIAAEYLHVILPCLMSLHHILVMDCSRMHTECTECTRLANSIHAPTPALARLLHGLCGNFTIACTFMSYWSGIFSGRAAARQAAGADGGRGLAPGRPGACRGQLGRQTHPPQALNPPVHSDG